MPDSERSIPAASLPGAVCADRNRPLEVERRDFTDIVRPERTRVQSMRGFDDVYTDIVDYRDGRIVDEWRAHDQLSMLVQVRQAQLSDRPAAPGLEEGPSTGCGGSHA